MEFYDVEQLKIKTQEWVQKAEVFVKQIPEPQIYAGIGVIFFTTLLLLLVRLFKRKKHNTIVLSGLSGSGKTTLFYQLRDGSSHQGTVTSMEPNEGTFVLHSEKDNKLGTYKPPLQLTGHRFIVGNNRSGNRGRLRTLDPPRPRNNGKLKPIHIVDVPGHSRLRPKLDDFLPQAAGIVFVVDALEFLPNCRAVSEYLYDILTRASVVCKKIPLLILCNKVDKPSAHSKEFIRKQLEKEIDKLRASRNAVSEADVANEYTLGTPGKAFGFIQCLNKVTVAESSSLTGEVSEVEQFIREHV